MDNITAKMDVKFGRADCFESSRIDRDSDEIEFRISDLLRPLENLLAVHFMSIRHTMVMRPFAQTGDITTLG